MSVIVPTASRPYVARMAAAVTRLLTLLALVLMPLGMASAPAMAHAMPAQHSEASMGHCDGQTDQNRAPAHSTQQMHCAMCTALPAVPPPTPSSRLKPVEPRVIATVSPFTGIVPEIATPPPRQA